MKAKSFAHKNKSRKKPAHKKQFLGTDVRTVTQLIELKCSKRRKLQIAKQLLTYAKEIQGIESAGNVRNMRRQLANEAVNDWTKAVKELKSELKEENIKRNKVHTPFANLLQ